MIVLYPIKPLYVERIFSGEKTYELRRRIPKKELKNVVIYCTAPTCRVVGYADVKGVHEHSPDNLWKLVSRMAGISKAAFDKYFYGSEVAYAIELINVKKFRHPFKVTAISNDMAVPQSFCYVGKDVFSKLKRRKSSAV